MGDDMNVRMDEIRNIANKYGPVLFGMGLTHLVDVGHRHLTDIFVEETIEKIIAESEVDAANGVTPVMSPGFQCEILRCAADLARFSPWTLFAYIKRHMEVGGI